MYVIHVTYRYFTLRKETDDDVDNERHFFRFKILDFLTVMNVGYNITKTTRMSYLLRDRQGSYEIMQPYVWNHLCYSYRKPGFSKAVLVCLQQLYMFQKSFSYHYYNLRMDTY